MDRSRLVPFLKWPGGKRWFITNCAALLPEQCERYIEPFLGGGSVFFYLQPQKALLGDVNPELINVYRCIKEDPARFEEILRRHQDNHGEEYYYRLRDWEPSDRIERAARLVYLNRTCFNGIYRVNMQGKFNVPKGGKTSVILNTDDFRGVSRLLANADLWIADFEVLIDTAQRDDLVFADPPYTVRHNYNAFIKYNETLFSWDDQIRLADTLARARDRGAKIVATNANHQSVQALYQERGFEYQVVSRYSSISANAGSRRTFEEIVVLAT